MKIKIQKTNSNAVIPSYAKPGDAGLDLTCISIKHTDKYVEYGTGLAVAIPEGFVGLLFPRSSLSKYNLVMANHVGVIDSGYRGEIMIRFKISGDPSLADIYGLGDRVAQLIVVPFPQVEFEEGDLDETTRGAGGFGSSGV